MNSGSVDYGSVVGLRKILEMSKITAPKKVDAWLHEVIGPELKTAMIEKAPVDSGFLKAHIVQVDSPGQVSVGTHGVSYAKYVVQGTRPHTITAKNGPMVFTLNGKTVFARTVHHPGTRPNPFMKDATKEVLRANLKRLTMLKGQDIANG